MKQTLFSILCPKVRWWVFVSLPFVSIVVLNFNGKTYLKGCLKSVFATKYPSYEAVLVDNGSTDGSLEMVQTLFKKDKRLKIIPLDRNYGYAEGNNIGYQHINSKAKYIIFLNNDTEVSRDWLKEIVKVMEQDNTIGASQPKILRKNFLDENGLRANFINVFGESLALRFSSKDPFECFYASGSALVVRRDILDKLGLFNPRFFLYYEETDLCWRIWLSNHKVVCVPSASVFHVGSATTSKTLTFTVFLFHYSKNRVYMLLTNYELKALLKFVPLTLLSYIAVIVVNSVLTIFKKSTHLRPSVLALIKALFYILFNFDHIWKDRMKVQHTIRKVKDDLLIGKLILIPHTPLPEPFLSWLNTLKSYI